jgi:hypothetical protein
VLLGPPVVNGGGQLVELGCQLVQVRAQGGVRCATDCRRADVTVWRTLRVTRGVVPRRRGQVHPRDRLLRVPAGRHVLPLSTSLDHIPACLPYPCEPYHPLP